MSDWKTAHRSFYYEKAGPPEDIVLRPKETAVLVIDIQNTYMETPSHPEQAARWKPFLDRMNRIVIPNTARLIELGRRTRAGDYLCQNRLPDRGRARALA